MPRFARALTLTLAALALACPLAPCTAAEPAPPNIVVFLVDDMGWQDTSLPFAAQATPLNRKYHTPNMERLAAQGMKFTNAYACAVCSPSRVSLMTGLNAARHRVTNWTLNKNTTTDAKHPTLDVPAWNVNGIAPQEGIPRTVVATALPAYLAQAGYRTIHVGKAHFGAEGTPGAEPKNLGFDVNIGGHAAGGPGSYLGEQNYSAAFRNGGHVWDVPGLEKYHGTKTFLTEALTIEALKAVDQAQADHKPFYLYLAHYAVHVPYAPDPRYYQKYVDAHLDKTEAMYAALVEGMDQSLGDVLDYLDQHKLAENTIILFMSDNGGLSAHGRGGKPDTHNAPLSCGKGSPREGGIRVPMLAKWPGITPPGSTCATPVIIEDFFPTVLQLAGVTELPPGLDGVSFVPLMRGEPTANPERPLFWHFPNFWGPGGAGYGPFSAMRTGDWKIIYYHASRKYELFNLADDLSETKNLAASQPERLAKMAAQLGAYLKDVNAQMPKVRATGAQVPLPGATAAAN